MGEFILYGVLLLLGLGLLIEHLHGKRQFRQAQRLEREGKYRDAVYLFVVTIQKRVEVEAATERIRALWRQHGPFDFHDIQEEIDSGDDEHKSCSSAGHGMTVADLKAIVSDLDHR